MNTSCLLYELLLVNCCIRLVCRLHLIASWLVQYILIATWSKAITHYSFGCTGGESWCQSGRQHSCLLLWASLA